MSDLQIYELEHCEVRCLVQKIGQCPICDRSMPKNKFTICHLNDYLTKSRSTKKAILIKPTKGLFKDYTRNDDLHIGITNHNGDLIEFNEKGLQFATEEWSECYELISLIDQSKTEEDYSIRYLFNDSNRLVNCLTRQSCSTDLNINNSSLTHSTPIEQQQQLFNNQSTGCRFNCQNVKAANDSIHHIGQFSSVTHTGDDVESLKKINSPISCNLLHPQQPSTQITEHYYRATGETIKSSGSNESNEKDQLVAYLNYIIRIVQTDPLIAQKFNSTTYDQLSNNCLDFVFFFIQLLDLEQFRNLQNKHVFCEQILKPKLNRLFQMIEFSRSKSDKYLVLERR